ncbi:hypothetical protein F2Q69_00009355 [Brassica cretica]|uniref:Uncharacterized protein n=1 Tax=Brassica cretica TaxID=69181 RepID=A0A8S9PI47_BRACR|nr:hypothetical protein F2Q69_00009355 [Brassica cretica]
MRKWSCHGGEAGTELRRKTEFVVVRGSGPLVRRRPWWLRFQLMEKKKSTMELASKDMKEKEVAWFRRSIPF